MIVFYFLVCIISIIIILLLSSFIIDIKKVEIQDIEQLKNIYSVADDKKYDEIFNYIKFDITIKLVLISVLPIEIANINNKKVKKIVHKIMVKGLKEKKRNLLKYKIKREKQKNKLRQIRRRINQHIKIKDADLNLRIGLTNAEVTAIATGFLNIIISMILLDLVSEMLEEKSTRKMHNKINETIKNLNYVVKPIYSDDFEFNLTTTLKVKFPIHALICQ